MHYFEEEYQGRFKNAESTEGIDPDQLWAGISSELEPESSRRRFAFWWLLLLLLLTSSGIGVYFYLTTDAGPTRGSVVEQDSVVEIDNRAIKTTTLQAQADQPEVMDEGKNLVEDCNIFTQPAQLEALSISVAKQQTSRERTQVTANSNFTSEQLQTNPEESRVETEKVETITFVAVSTDPTTASPTGQETPEVAPLDQLATLEFWPQWSSTNDNLPHVSPQISNIEGKIPSLSFGTKVAVLSWQDRFQEQGSEDSLALDLADSHRSQGGYALGFLVEKQLGIHWSLSTGLEYQQIFNTFEWTRSWDTFMVRNDLPTPDIIDANATRYVKHQNELQSLHIPIALGYETGQGKWSWGVQASVGLNFLLQQKGKTLRDRISIRAFEEADTGPYGQFFLSAQLQPFLGFRFGDHTQIRLHGQVRHQWHGTSEVFQRKHSALLFGGGLGLFYSL